MNKRQTHPTFHFCKAVTPFLLIHRIRLKSLPHTAQTSLLLIHVGGPRDIRNRIQPNFERRERLDFTYPRPPILPPLFVHPRLSVHKPLLADMRNREIRFVHFYEIKKCHRLTSSPQFDSIDSNGWEEPFRANGITNENRLFGISLNRLRFLFSYFTHITFNYFRLWSDSLTFV